MHAIQLKTRMDSKGNGLVIFDSPPQCVYSAKSPVAGPNTIGDQKKPVKLIIAFRAAEAWQTKRRVNNSS